MAKRYDSADYRALKRSEMLSSLAKTPSMRFDSAEDASAFFARELDHVKSKTYDRLYPQFTALNTLPRTSEADPGAETVTFYGYDKTGLAQIISNYATDLPRADIKGEPTTVHVRSLGASYGYSVQEMRASRLVGKALDARKAEAARFQIENLANRLSFVGDQQNGITGLLSSWNDIPLHTIGANASGKTKWAEKTADEILLDVNSMVQQVAKLTGDVERPDSMMLASSVYYDIANRRIPDTNITVLRFILDNQPFLKNIIPTPELEAGNTDTNPLGSNVAVLFTNDPEKMSIEEPMPFYQHPLQTKSLEIEVPCESRFAGLCIYYPYSALIATGV